MRRALLFIALATLACTHAQPAAPPAEAPEPVTIKAWLGVPLPDICLQPPEPLDDAGRDALITLERHVVHDVLFAPNPEPENYWEKHGDGHINAIEVGSLMHKYSVSDVLFAFPVPTVGIQKVSMVRLGGKTALLFKWAAGPAGKPPQGVRWMWGTWGRLCAVPNAAGTWHAVPVGTLTVS